MFFKTCFESLVDSGIQFNSNFENIKQKCFAVMAVFVNNLIIEGRDINSLRNKILKNSSGFQR